MFVVYEEVGFDIHGLIQEDEFIEKQSQESNTSRMYNNWNR